MKNEKTSSEKVFVITQHVVNYEEVTNTNMRNKSNLLLLFSYRSLFYIKLSTLLKSTSSWCISHKSCHMKTIKHI